MLIIDGTIGSNIPAFLARLNEESLPCEIIMYEEYFAKHSSCRDHPTSLKLRRTGHDDLQGIIYMRVMPEIAFKRTSSQLTLTLEQIQQVYQQKNEQFIENKNNPKELQDLPVLVLNGNIDFQTDFSQFYSHLFYIKRFLKQIQEKKEIAMGIYKEKSPQRHCC